MARRNLLLGATLFLGLGLAVLLMWVPAGSLPAALAQGPDTFDTYYVALDGLCGGQSPCYSTVQAAVDAVDDVADTVLVAGGTYTGVNSYAIYSQTLYISKTVTVRGGYTTTNWTTSEPASNPTTLDAEGLGRVVHIRGSSITPTLESLRLTGGSAAAQTSQGGGVYIYRAPATISNCVVFSNTAATTGAGDGGGVYLFESPAILTGNIVKDNVASRDTSGNGGGLYLRSSSATLTNNRVQDNVASRSATGWGGGLFLYNKGATLVGNRLQGNFASTDGTGHGGGIYATAWSGSLIVSDNEVKQNTAGGGGDGDGGGLHILSASAQVTGNRIEGNVASASADGRGGGAYFSSLITLSMTDNTVMSNTATLNGTATGQGGGVAVYKVSPFNLTNNVFAGNQANTQGSGLWFEGPTGGVSGVLLHNTITGNSATAGSQQGVYAGVDASLTFTNTIISGHAGTGITVTTGSTASLEATLWHDNGSDTGGSGTITTGTLNVYGSPAFVDPSTWDYHLSAASAAIDAGLDAGVTGDIDGDTRPAGTGYDLGADEYAYGLLFTPDRLASTKPGRVITYTHTLTNTGNGTDTFVLTYAGDHSWTADYDSPIVLASGASATVLVSITVPQGIVSGTVDTTIITATSQADSDFSSAVTDTTTVTQLALVEFEPDSAGITGPGTTITYSHVLTNTGNGPDTFALDHSSGQGWWVDYDTPIALGRGLAAVVVISVSVPGGTISGTVDTTVVTATSQADGSVFVLVTETTTVSQVAGLEMEPDHAAATQPGQTIIYTHILTNTGNGPDTFDLSHDNQHTWTVLYDEPVLVGWGLTATVVVSVEVPAGTVSGTLDTTVLTATSQAGPAAFASVTDTTTVTQLAMVELEPDRAGTTAPGTTITYSHVLTNTGNGPDTFDLSHSSDQGWLIGYDSPVALGEGLAATVVVSVEVPAGTISGTVDTTILTATSQADGSVSTLVTDTTTVSQAAGLEFEPDHAAATQPGRTITYTHILTNTGNGPDSFDLSHDNQHSWIVLYDEPVLVGWGMTATVVMSVEVPAGTVSGTLDTTVLTATSQAGPASFASVTDTTTVTQLAMVELEPDRAGTTEPGATITYSHVLTNTGNGPDTFDLSHSSDQGWLINYDSPVALADGLTATVVVSVSVPGGTVSGTVDTTILTATSQADGSIFALMTDTTAVSQAAGLELRPDNMAAIQPGRTITYTHVLTNTGNGPDTFDLSHDSQHGWTVLYVDPVAVGWGMTATVVVSVQVPAGTVSGTVESTILTATSRADLTVTASAADTTTVTQLAYVELEPDRAGATDPGTTITYSHVLTNAGNGPDTFDLGHDNEHGWVVDYDTPISLGRGLTTTVVMSVTVPPDTLSDTVDTTVLTATSQADGTVSDPVTDTTTVQRVVAVQFGADEVGSGVPAEVVTYTHVLTNDGNYLARFTLTSDSSESWGVDHAPWIDIPAWQTATVVVSLTLSPDAISGTVDTTVVTAASLADPAVMAQVADTTTVQRVVGVLLEANESEDGLPGEAITFSHVLTNNGNYEDTFDLAYASSEGWVLSAPPPTVTLAAWQTGTVTVVVSIDSRAISGTVDTTVITATSQADPSASDPVTDTTTVQRVVAIQFESDESDNGVPGEVITFSHVLTNDGNYQDRFALSGVSSENWAVDYAPWVDIPAWQTATVVVSVAIPSDAISGTIDTTVVTATSLTDGAVLAGVTDTTTVQRVVALQFQSDEADSGVPGEVVTYTHVLTNDGNYPDRFTLISHSSQSWSIDHAPWIDIPAWQTATVAVSVTIPADAISSTVDTTVVTATSQADTGVSATVTDTTEVQRIVGVRFEPDREGSGLPGQVVTYTHVLTNDGNYADRFTVTSGSSLIWGIDHEPWIDIPAWLTATVLVSITIPSDAISDTLDTTVVTVTSLADGSVFERVTDTTTVERVVSVQFEADEADSGVPSEVVTYTHVLTNDGNYLDRFTLTSDSSESWYTDHEPWIDIPAWQTAAVVVSLTIPADAISGTVDIMVLTATSGANAAVTALVTDTTTVQRVVDVLLESDDLGSGVPGEIITYSHVLTNNGNYEDTFDLAYTSSQGWVVSAPPVTVTLAAWQTGTVTVAIGIDSLAISGTVDTTVITATSQADPSASDPVTDTTTVLRVVAVQFEADGADSGVPGEVITYSHVLTNDGNYQDRFTLSSASSENWAVDHAPWVDIPAWQTATLILSVTIPADAISGTIDTTVVTATSLANTSAFASVTDTTTVQRVVAVRFEADESGSGLPAEVVTYTHVLTNDGNYLDRFTLASQSSETWQVDHAAWVDIPAWLTATLAVSVTIPPDAISGTIDTTVVTAKSVVDGSAVDWVTDTTTVERVVAVQFEADEADSGVPGEMITYSHVLTNDGNYQDRFTLTSDSSQSWTVDHAPWIDIPAWQTVTVVVSVTIPTDAISGTIDTTVVTATSLADVGVYASVMDTTTVQRVVAVQFEAPTAGSGVPGGVVTYTHVLTNNGNYLDRFTLTSQSSETWQVDHVPWIDVPAWQTATLVLSVTIPSDAISNTVDTTVVTATSGADPAVTARVTDTTTVLRVLNVLLEANESQSGVPGEVITYSHVLTNHGNYEDTFDLAYTSTEGWVVSAPPVTVTLAAWQTGTVTVAVGIDNQAISGTVDTTMITATSQADPSVSDPVTDTTTVRRVVSIQFEADESDSGLPAEVITYSHILTNNGNFLDRFTLVSASSEGWDVDHAPWIDIPAWQTTTVVVSVTIPADAISGTVDTTVVTATSQADAGTHDRVTDTTAVDRLVDVQFETDKADSGLPGEVITYSHLLTNNGNFADRFLLTSDSSQGWDLEHLAWVDIAAWQTATVVVSVTIPADAISSTVDTTVVTATSQANATASDPVVDTTTVLRVVDLDLAPGNSTSADPGTVVAFAHTLTNHGNYTDTFTLIHGSSQGWSVDHDPLITLAAWQTATVAVSVTVPQDAISGTVDATLILAISHANLSETSSAWDTTRVNLVTGMSLAPECAADAVPGQVVTYSHVLTNQGSYTETFAIAINTSQGWAADYEPALTLGPWQTVTLEVGLTVPLGTISGTLDTTLVTATLQSDPEISATLTDTTTVIQVPSAELAPDHEQAAFPGAMVVYTHILTNTGNYTDTFDLTFDSSQNWIVASRPISVQLGTGLTETVVVTLEVPSLALGGTVDLTVITATSQADPDVQVATTDRTVVDRVFGLEFAPDRASSALPGQVVTYSHVLTNNGSYMETYNLTSSSSQGWTTGHVPWLQVGAWQTTTVVVSVTVPSAAISSTIDTTLVTATLQANPGISATVTEATTVVQVVGADLRPDHLSLVPPGATIVYSHVLTNTGNHADRFDLAFDSSQGWILASRPVSVLLGVGLSETVVVTIGVPGTAVSDTVDLTVITATSQADPSYSVTVTDTTRVGQVVGVGLAPDRASDAHPGALVTYTHVLTNYGSHSQIYDIDSDSDQNWDVGHVPWLELGAWQTATVVVTMTVPPNALSDTIDTTLITAELRANPAVSATVTDTTTVLQIARAEFTPDYDAVVRPGTTIVYGHVLTNTGNHADTFDLAYTSSLGWVTTMRPVSAALGVGLTRTVVITVEVPGAAISSTLDLTVITATSRADSASSVSVTDTTLAGRIEGVELAPDCSASSKPGVPVLCSHTLTNTGNGPDLFHITHSSDVGSAVGYATPILLAKGQTTTLEVEITLPLGTLSGTIDTVVMTATSSGNPSAFANVTETVTTTRSIGVVMVPDRGGSADPGTTKVYTHTLTNTGNDDDIFGIIDGSTQGWAVDYDQPIALGPGASHTLVVSITVPPDAAAGVVDSTLLMAFSYADFGTSSTARDTTWVNQVGGLQFTPDRQASGLPGDAITFSHTLTNAGNGQDTFDLTHDSDQGWTVEHEPILTLGVNETATLVVSVTIPPDALSGTLDTTMVTATSRVDGAAAAVTDKTDVNRVVDLSLKPDQSQQVGPGARVVYNHILTNTGNFTDTFNLSYSSDLGWVEGTPLALVELDPGDSTTVAVTIAVPAETLSGTIDTLTITATSQANPTVLAAATETTTVIRVVQVSLAPDSDRGANPAETVTYTHVLTNGGNYTDTFDLEYASSQGWVVAAPPASMVLTAWQTATVEIVLQVDGAAISDTVDTTVLTATSRADAAIYDLVVDTTAVKQVADVQFVPDRKENGLSGELVTYTHTITNTGNGPDTYDLTHRSSLGWSVGNTGLVALSEGQATTIIVSITVPLDAISGTVDTAVITATSRAQAAVSASVIDTTRVDRVVDLVFVPDHARSAGPAEMVTYIHVLTNTGNYTDTFDLVYLSSQGWIVGTPPPSFELPAGESRGIEVQIMVPAATLSDTVDTLVITATSQASPGITDTVTDITTVANAPALTLEPDLAGGVDAGSFTTYNHTLTNLGNLVDTFNLGLVSSQGWAVVSPSTPVQLDPGDSVQVVVTVTVPADTVSGTVDTTIVTAASQTDPSIDDSVTDTTTAGQVPGVSLVPDRAKTGSPDTIVAYTHTLLNTGNGTDTFLLTHESSQGWDVDYDTPVTLGAGESTSMVVSITVPANTALGVVDKTSITAISRTDGRVDDSAIDTTTVGLLNAVSLQPDHSQDSEPGGTITYQHILTNNGNDTDTYTLELSSSQDWAQVAPVGPITLVPGGEETVTVTVNVPSDAGDGTVDTTEVVARSQTDGTVFDKVTDETTVVGGVYQVYLPMVIR